MNTADLYPYPVDDPELIRGFLRSLSDVAAALGDAQQAVEGTRASLEQRWDSPAGGRAVTEVDALGSVCAWGSGQLGGGVLPLHTYATALEDARIEIDGIRAAHDEAEASRAAAVDAIATSGLEVLVAAAEELALDVAHTSRLTELAVRYQDVLLDVTASARLSAEKLMHVAAEASPAPESLDPGLARARALDRLPFLTGPDVPLVRRAGDVLLVDAGPGDDDVRITRNFLTGGVVVTVNGAAFRIDDIDAGDIVVRTFDGNDVINVGPGMDVGFTLLAGDDDDLVAGGRGADVVRGGDGDDTVVGGQGNDVLDAGRGDNLVLDELSGPAGFLGVLGTRLRQGGTVPLRPGGGDDLVVGGAGVDRIEVGAGDDEVWAGRGDDVVTAGTGDDAVFGEEGDDVIDGGDRHDRLDGGEGDDDIDGGVGDDEVTGGAGDDIVYAGVGDDVVDGGAGGDHLDGFEGRDVLRGGGADDIVSGGSGADLIDGGRGQDVVYTGSGRDEVSDPSGGVVHAQADDVVAAGPDVPRVTVEIGALPRNIRIEGSLEFQLRVRADLETLAGSPVGQQTLDAIAQANPDGTLTITDGAVPDPSAPPGDVTIAYDPGRRGLVVDGQGAPPITELQRGLAEGYDALAAGAVVDDHRFDDPFGSRRPTKTLVDHPPAATEDALRDELGLPDRPIDR